MEIQIGDRFIKHLSKRTKGVECEVIDIITRTSTKTGKVVGAEYWAKSDTYAFGHSFEVAKSTIIRNKLNNKQQ